MEENTAYYCDHCNKVLKSGKMEFSPECCGHEMKFISVTECVKDPAWAEHARWFDEDGPCDPSS
jgi:hypothetical protein